MIVGMFEYQAIQKKGELRSSQRLDNEENMSTIVFVSTRLLESLLELH